ncbi:MAG TPA: hypothetical protein PKD64_04670 [Pirellulaceae bacterium]|nr:hypothetical protein [Pirellulaceae bacterium]HMO91467.1 hypothetical protein [Pirellulaceae bacterium]HMP69456.1 hypothetical protein [Pirellulaceae bacterium]
MPIYVTPFYDSKDNSISVGTYSEQLATADVNSILELAKELDKDKDRLRAEVMYVTAIRMYDLGHKNEAVYWFYLAQYRSRVFGSILDRAAIGSIGSEAFELIQAYASFNELAGKYINGYAFGSLQKLEQILLAVLKEGETLADFDGLYPEIKFMDQVHWAAKNKNVADGLIKLVDYIKVNADSIKEQRAKNGIEGKY